MIIYNHIYIYTGKPPPGNRNQWFKYHLVSGSMMGCWLQGAGDLVIYWLPTQSVVLYFQTTQRVASCFQPTHRVVLYFHLHKVSLSIFNLHQVSFRILQPTRSVVLYFQPTHNVFLYFLPIQSVEYLYKSFSSWLNSKIPDLGVLLFL